MFVMCSYILMCELKYIVSFIIVVFIANEGRHVRMNDNFKTIYVFITWLYNCTLKYTISEYFISSQGVALHVKIVVFLCNRYLHFNIIMKNDYFWIVNRFTSLRHGPTDYNKMWCVIVVSQWQISFWICNF